MINEVIAIVVHAIVVKLQHLWAMKGRWELVKQLMQCCSLGWLAEDFVFASHVFVSLENSVIMAVEADRYLQIRPAETGGVRRYHCEELPSNRE
jgi:hypothetical protein